MTLLRKRLFLSMMKVTRLLYSEGRALMNVIDNNLQSELLRVKMVERSSFIWDKKRLMLAAMS